MLGYAALEFYRLSREERRVDQREERLLEKSAKSVWSIFIPAVADARSSSTWRGTPPSS